MPPTESWQECAEVLSPELLGERLAAAHLRVTPQRLATWQAIVEGPPHATILDVYGSVARALPPTTLRTVYEAVHLLERLGLIRLLHLPGGARIELEREYHAHGYCERCGAIVNLVAAPPSRLESDVGESFYVRAEEDMVFGLCQRCHQDERS